MYSRHPSLSATRVVSLSTEHLNHGVFGRDPNNFPQVSNEPCPCQHHRLQQHWQYTGRSPQSRRKPSSAAPTAVRSDSAAAVPRDPSNDVYPPQQREHQKPSLCDSLHALTILKFNSTRCHHCPPGSRDFDQLPLVPCSSATTVRSGGTGASRYQSTAYELSDDLRAKEVEFIERTYGGRLRAQHAARVIQAKYRDYRMRAQYDRLRSSRRPPRQQTDFRSLASDKSTAFCANDLPLSREHLASMEDLVLDRAYLDWETEVANGVSGSIIDLSATQGNRASAPSACVADREHRNEAVSATATIVPTTTNASCSSLVTTARHPQHYHQFSSASASSGSPGTATGSTSGFVSSPGSCSSSGSLSNEPPKAGVMATTGDPPASYTDIAATTSPLPPSRQQQHTRTLSNPPPVLATASSSVASKPSPKSYLQQVIPANHAVDDVVRHQQQYNQSSLEQSPCAYYLLDSLVTAERASASSQVYVAVPLNQESPSSQQLLQPQQHQYHQQNQRDNYKYLRVVCPAGQTLPAAPVLTQPAVLVRRSSLGSNSSSTPPPSAPTRPTTSSAAATPIWCTPDGKMYTLAYAATGVAASAGGGASTDSRIALVPQVVNSMGEPRRVVHSQSLNHNQSAQQQPHQVLLVRRQACDNSSHPHRVLHTTAVSSTPVQRCQVVKPLVASVDVIREGSTALQQQHQPILVKVHPPGLVAAAPPAATTTAATRESATSVDRSRKRMYRVCLNYFNKSPVKGISMLIKYRFLETSPRQIARFLLTRRGLSRSAIGEYLGEMKDDLAKATTRQFMRELDFRDKDVDEALRTLMSRFRTPGESQKIVHLLTEFQSAYVEQNPARVKAQFQNPDSVMILAYAIVMLHTDLYSPSIRPQAKMTGQEFVKNLRGIDDGEDLDRNLLLSIYNRIQAQEMSVLPDHTDQVRKIQRLLTGPLTPPSLVLSQRRLVCYCRLYEVPDRSKRDRAGAHEREIFLFNDLLLVTKAFQKRRKDAPYIYQVRACVNLMGLRVSTFETPAYSNGIALYKSVTSTANTSAASDNAGSCLPFERTSSFASDKKSPSPAASGRDALPPVVCLNTKTIADRMRLVDDLQECILEAAEMDRVRLEEVLSKQQDLQRPQKPSCGGGGGVKRIESDLSSASSAPQKVKAAAGQSVATAAPPAPPQSQCALCTCMTEPLFLQSQSSSQQNSVPNSSGTAAAYKCSSNAFAYRSPPSRLIDQHRGF
uniref:SEC7 domain-containing protein n=1 Tax=Schistocephalus solidus TaxID=70667 RepID=A0A0X3P489_SCHSO